MAEPAGKTTPRRQGPKRSEASKAAILDAVCEELTESGWRNFSVDNLARRAKASKQTIYRWWPSIGALCVDAALTLIPDPPTDVRDPVERVAALLAPLEGAARTGNGAYVVRAAIMAAADDEDAGEKWRSWVANDIRGPLRMVMAELANRSIVPRNYDIDVAVDRLLGPLINRLLLMRGPIRDGFSRDCAEALLASYRRG